jgi:hypothetical protein
MIDVLEIFVGLLADQFFFKFCGQPLVVAYNFERSLKQILILFPESTFRKHSSRLISV